MATTANIPPTIKGTAKQKGYTDVRAAYAGRKLVGYTCKRRVVKGRKFVDQFAIIPLDGGFQVPAYHNFSHEVAAQWLALLVK